MIRLFAENKKRSVRLLDGPWLFITDGENRGLENGWHKSIPSGCRNTFIPSLWTCELGTFDYEGVAWYFREVETAAKNAYFHFEAVTGQSDVFLDGKKMASHYGSFTGFGFHADGIPCGKHLLAIRVDNTHNHKDTIPLAKVDWYHHGGISRDVWLHEYDGAHIESLRISYQLSENAADVTAKVGLYSAEKRCENLRIFVEGAEAASCEVNIDGETEAVLSFKLSNIKRWSPENPSVYRIEAEITADGLAETMGFRTIEAKDGKLLLNGERLIIKGVNRHEEHPDFGFALPAAIMQKDLAIIKQLGCNAIRASHYANARLFLDMCDREGILLWEEIPMWGFPEAALAEPLVLERGLMMHRELVLRDINHPSIIMWGMHNEVDTFSKAAYKLTKAFAEQTRAMDSSRLLTMATHHPMIDICLPLIDVIGVNKYYGWYDGGLDKWPGFIDEFFAKLENEGVADKPVIMSEFGAGGIPGVRGLENQKWSEDYQAEYLDYTLGLFHSDERLSGSYIWQYCDIRVCKEKELERPRSFNNKGIFDEYRRPKLAVGAVKKHYKGK